MHACIVCHEASLTGAPRIGFDIALSLAADNDVTLLSKVAGELIDMPQYASLRANYRVLNTSHLTCDMTYRERVQHGVDILSKLKPDLLYVNSVSSGEWCEAGAQVEIPVALHTHETRESLPSLLSSVCTPRILTWTDLLIGASAQAMDDLEELTSTTMSAGNRLNVGIFIDTAAVLAQSELSVEAPLNAQKSAWKQQSNRSSVAMCGLAQHRKGADIFFELAEQLPQYDFVWIGPWSPAETDLNASTFERFKARSLENFYVTGLTTNPYAYLRMADIFVLTSREDPNPLVVAEALVLGKKVVSFAATGASVAMLESHGYALTGAPDVNRLRLLLPKIVEGDAEWLVPMKAKVRAEVDGEEKLATLTQTLVQFSRQWRVNKTRPNADGTSDYLTVAGGSVDAQRT